MSPTLAAGFEERINLCRYLASRYPAWVGSVEMSECLTGCKRTHQRLLSGLVSIGYLERRNTSPEGWRVVKSKVKGFKAL